MLRMDRDHPKFECFTDQLAARLCRKHPDGRVTLKCTGTYEVAASVLRSLDDISIARTFQHFQHCYNAFCDCEILLNVDPTDRLSAGCKREGHFLPTGCTPPSPAPDVPEPWPQVYLGGSCTICCRAEWQAWRRLVATGAALRVDALRLIHGGEAFHLALEAALRGQCGRDDLCGGADPSAGETEPDPK